MRERVREAHVEQRERGQADQGGTGQEVRLLVARRRRGGIRIRGQLRAQKPHVHVLRRQPGRLRMEVFIVGMPRGIVYQSLKNLKNVPPKFHEQMLEVVDKGN